MPVRVLGEAITRTFSQHGAQVLAVDSPDSAIETQYRNVHGVTGVALDISAPESADALAEQVESRFGALDIVVNNYDWQLASPINDQDDDELAELIAKIETQFPAVVNVALPWLQKSPAGRIINIGCVRSVFGRDSKQAAVQARRAIAEITSTIAAENGKYGITANYVQPGAIMTAGSRQAFAADKELRDLCIGRSAAGRLGEPIDIAKVVLFLATDDSAFVSGTGIVADGGLIPDS